MKRQVTWAQQDSNLRPLGDHPPFSGVRHGTPDQVKQGFSFGSVRPDSVGKSDGKVTADLGRRINCLNWRVILLGVASCALVAGIVWWLS